MRDKLTRVALRTSLSYAFFAALWIVFLGVVMAALIRDPDTAVKIGIYKGWAFVAVTAFLLYGTLRKQMRWLEKEVDAREQAEQLMRENKERFCTIFCSSPMGITLSRLDDGRLVDVNPALLSMLGCSRREAVGRTSREIGVWISPEDLDRFVGVTRTQGRVEGVEFQFRKKSGEIGTMLGSAEVIHLAGEDHLLSMMLDITDRKLAEETAKESESQFRSAFEASPIGMALVAPDGRWLKVNKFLCDSIGYSEQELLTKTSQDITHPDDLENDLEHLKRLVNGEILYYRIEKRYYHKDGYIVWVLPCVSVVRDVRGRPLYFVSQIEDIAERKFQKRRDRYALSRRA